MAKSSVKTNYCDKCMFSHYYGNTDELYCDFKETFVDEIDSCEEFERKNENEDRLN